MKYHNSPALETRTVARSRLVRGCDECGERRYVSGDADLLFSVRASRDGRFAYEGINTAFETALATSTQEMRGLDISDCLTPKDAKSVRDALRACLAEKAEIKVRHRLGLGGQPRDMETTVIPLVGPRNGAYDRLIGRHRNLHYGYPGFETDTLTQAYENVSLAAVQDDIQQRIASELHDSTCQYLIAASLGLMRIRDGLGVSPETVRLCGEIDVSIATALRELRAFAYLLYPKELSIGGLKATIEQYVRGFTTRTLLRASTRISSVADRLPYVSQHALFRVVQEGLTNVFRHARATEVKIVVESTDDQVQLTIIDDGRGFHSNDVQSHGKTLSFGVGIPAMRARLEQLGGTLELQSSLAADHPGAVLCARIPRGLSARNRQKRAIGKVAHGYEACDNSRTLIVSGRYDRRLRH